MTNKNITIGLLVGGASPEREVSKDSCVSILNALKNLGYNYVLIDPAYGLDQPKEEKDFFEHKDLSEISYKNYVKAIDSKILDNVDLVFIGLHGKWGEDGTVQSLIELRGLKYTGSGVLSSALAMDKSASKVMFQQYGVRTPKWCVVQNNSVDLKLLDNKIKLFFGYPCIVKPNDQGSTIGLTVCRGEVELKAAIESALNFSDKALIEEYIPGRELTVGVMDKEVLPVLEIKPKHGLYDYECKYSNGMSEYEVPANLPSRLAKRLKQQAMLAFSALGCKNYARCDFRVNKWNRAYCLEVNTLPGMTSHSLVPKMAKSIGIGFDELIDKIIKFELEDENSKK
ncbi:MAG: D-alanine--D-alanine ligase [Ignavibacteriales bacterium]|nr:D-alanine--D-alanine ligase [Ignavibacteriales bacterium]